MKQTEDLMTDKKPLGNSKVTDKLKLRGKYYEVERLTPGTKVKAWKEGGPVFLGKILTWDVIGNNWGCTVVIFDKQEFYPYNFLCVRKLTPLEEALS